MLKARVLCRGVNKVGKAKLFNVAKPLKPGVLQYIEYQLPRNFDETVNRVVDYFPFVQVV
jgi:hypothetical protein